MTADPEEVRQPVSAGEVVLLGRARRAAREAEGVVLPPGCGGLVLDAWRPWWNAATADWSRPPEFVVDGEIVWSAWGCAVAVLPAGIHTVLARASRPLATQRVQVEAGETVHLDYVADRRTSASGRLVPPGTRPGGINVYGQVWASFVIAYGLWFVLMVAIRSRVHSWIVDFPWAGYWALALWAALFTWPLVHPRFPVRPWRTQRVLGWAQRTRARLDAASHAPGGSRFLGDHPARSGPQPPADGGAIRLTARYTTFAGVFSVTHQEPYRDLPRVRDREVKVTIDGRQVPADWSTWWHPVSPGAHTVAVEHPVPVSLEVEVMPGQVLNVYHWAHLMGDRLDERDVVPELSGATLTLRRFRLGKTDEPALPGRSPGALLTDSQHEALRNGIRRSS